MFDEEDFVDMRKIMYQDKEMQQLKNKIEPLQLKIREVNEQKHKLSMELEDLKKAVAKRKQELYKKYLY